MAEIHLSGARAIDLAALAALRQHGGRRTEPHLVAAIFRDPKFLQAIIGAVDPAWGAARVNSVFVHQKPQVKFSCCGAPRRCELGDALVVYRERLRPGQVRRQAMLFQAKMWDGLERGGVITDPDQHALYGHWPPFTIAGGPAGEIRLPPGDYARVLGLTDTATSGDVPRVSPRRPVQPGCVRETLPWQDTMGTLGRAIRGLVRFDVGEVVREGWATAVGDMIARVGPASPGGTYRPVGHRGRSVSRPPTSGRATMPEVDALDSLLDSTFSVPPPDEPLEPSEEGNQPLSILVIDGVALE
jgi:hypothetical protein